MDTLDACANEGLYPVTTHNYGGFGDGSGINQEVDEWHNLGLTVGKTPGQSGGENVPKVLAMLDRHAEHGMKCFVNDQRCASEVAMKEGDDAVRRGFEAALKDYGHHPALMGFEVGDEPAREKIGPVFRAYGIQREMAPHLTPFLSFGGYSPGGTEWMGLRSYGRYLDEFIEIGHANLIFHNNYALMCDALDEYFLSYKMYTDSSARHNNLPWWVTLCCVSHMHFRVPSENDLRWQVNSAAALGCKGVAWYLLGIGYYQNYRNSPFDENGQKTETYYNLQRVMKNFHRKHSPLLMKLTFQRTFFVGGAYGGYPNTIDSELVRSVSEASFPVIVSEFKDKDGNDYIAVVNNSGDKYGQAVVTLHGRPEVKLVGDGCRENETRLFFDDANPKNPATMLGPWLAPGQMDIYRIKSEAPKRL